MSVGLVSHEGETLVHRPLNAAPAPCLTAVAPDREGLVVAVEGRCPWSGLSELCAAQDLPVGLGHALDLHAIPGGKANHDQLDSPTLAALRRGGMRPNAAVYPAAMRGPRDRWRRRTPLLRHRAARMSPVHHPHAPDTLPDIGTNSASHAHRAGGAARVHDPAVHKTIAVARARSTDAAERLRD
jgi:hypothetical protein